MLSAIRALPTRVLLGSIVSIAILLRVIFFVGLVSGDPQDAGLYYGNAFALYHDGPRYLDLYRNLTSDFLANPIDQFNVRPMVTYPIAALFFLLGPGEMPAVLWSLVCSTLSILVVYRLGSFLHGRDIGCVAALLCAFYPLEVINGTRILSDVPVGMFCSLSLLLIVEGVAKDDRRRAALAGCAVAGAYLANGRALVFFLALSGCVVLLSMMRRTSWWTAPLFTAGFLAVFAIEALAYFRATGEPFLSYRIQAGASLFKYLHEPVSSIHWGWLDIKYTNGLPFELLRTVLLVGARPTSQFGLFFFVFFAAALYSLWQRANVLLVTVALGLFLYLEFGPVRVSVDWPRHQVQYMMLFKQQRFLLMLTGPFMVLAAYFVRAIGRRSQLVAVALVAVLFVTSLAAITRTRSFYRDGLQQLRDAAEFVSANPGQQYFGDLWAILHLKIFTRYRVPRLTVLDTRTSPAELARACVILGGSRGVELLADYVESTLPPFARQVLDTGVAPPGWVRVREVKGDWNPLRHHDLAIYCLP
jgi:4-amino-4-deoxy-L-arabinose transferase-like glycosyltransferase